MEPPTVREVTKRLKNEGWSKVREKGGRRIYRKGSKVVTLHGKDGDRLKKGTWAKNQTRSRMAIKKLKEHIY